MTQEARQEMLKRFKVKTSDSPQFRILSDEKLAELHSATLRVLEKTGVAFECPEAIELLGM